MSTSSTAPATELWKFRGSQTFRSVSISADGQVIAAGSEDRNVTLFTPEGEVAWQQPMTDQVNQVAVYGGASGFRVADRHPRLAHHPPLR